MSSVSSTKKRIVIIDWMKAFLILCPIISHSEYFYTEESKATDLPHLLIIEFCVPGFMILSGYTYMMGNSERSVKQMYAPKGLLKSFVRFTFPMLVAFLFYELYQVINHKFSVTSAIKDMILGKYGEGGYYYHMMIGFMLIAPLICVIVRSLKFKGVLIVAGFNALYQLGCNLIGLKPAIFRVIVFRYVTMIALGMYAYLVISGKIKPKLNFSTKILIAIGFIVGFAYKLAPHFGYKYQFFKYNPWGRTSMVTALYFFPVVFLILYYFHDKSFEGAGRFGKSIELIGKVSYHILFAQMIYYVYRPLFDEKVYNISYLGGFVEITVDLVVSIGVGVLFYLLDSKFVTGRLKKL